MEQILLSEEGIFPITKDKNGKALKVYPNTGLSMSGTVQGEGRFAGTPSLFIRLAGCNLRCIWDKGDGDYSLCDTPLSVFGNINSISYSFETVISIIRNNIGNLKHLVVTGGEPLLQAKSLTELCRQIKKELGLFITVETNGTLFDEELAKQVDMFSISPKLSATNPIPQKLKEFGLTETEVHKSHNTKRKNIQSLQSYLNFSNNHNKALQLKFVVTNRRDDIEIKAEFLTKLTGWKDEDIFIMPLGATKEELKLFTLVALEMAIANGWRFSPRMHIDLFNESSGV